MAILVSGGAGYIGSHTCVEPVSYTHLDVYKRQLRRGGFPIRPLGVEDAAPLQQFIAIPRASYRALFIEVK